MCFEDVDFSFAYVEKRENAVCMSVVIFCGKFLGV